jgi:hypothetical protein
MRYCISNVMTLLEVSHANVYRIVQGELEFLRLSGTSKLINLEGAATVIAGWEKSTGKE